MAACLSARLPARAIAALAIVCAALAQTDIANADPKISVISSQTNESRSTEHLSGDALPFGSRYKIVIVPDSDRALSVGVTGNKKLFHSSRVTAGRPIQLPSSGGWYNVPSSADELRVTVSQDGASREHVISPVDPSTPKTVPFDSPAGSANPGKATPLVAPLPPQDFQALFQRYRAVAIGLGNTKDAISGRGAASAVFRKASPSVVVVMTDVALGGGVVIAPGEVLTNWHVVENAKVITVGLKPSGAAGAPRVLHEAKLTRYDQVADLALVKFSGVTVPALALGDEKKLEVGHTVHAIGHPEREFWTYTQGVISQIRPGYKWNYGDGMQHAGTVIQTQTPISPGSSGGPLLDDNAAVIGITSYSTEPAQNLNFAVSVSEIRRFLTSNEDRIAGKVLPPQAPAPTAKAPAPTAKAAAAQSCEPKTLGAHLDSASGKTITLFDTNCGGRANVVSVADKSGRRPEYALIDALGDRKTAIKIVFNFRENTNLWIFYGRRDGVPTAYGYEYNGSGRPGRFVAVDGATR